MKAFAETVASLGRPILDRKIGPRFGPQALVARWKHGDARVQINAADALRVCLSLRGGHTVRLSHGSLPAKTIVSGSVTVFAPDRYTDVQIEGEADVVQIFIDSAFLNEEAGSPVAYASSFDLHEAELQAAALRLFVSARGGDPDADLLMETSMWRVIECLISRFAQDRPTRLRGGMARGAMRRVEELIADRFDAEDLRAPTIEDLARAAGMSVSHFIRAFRRSTGATPYQHVLGRRIDRAMGLLARPECSVAEVADSTGYASPSHFVASFRQRLGVTPGMYRDAVLA